MVARPWPRLVHAQATEDGHKGPPAEWNSEPRPPGARRRGHRFQARWRDPSGRERSLTFASVDEAASHLLALSSGTISVADSATVGEWCARWRAAAQGRPSTLARDDSYMRTHFLPVFGERPVDDVTTWDLQEWLATLQEKLAPASVHKVHVGASKVFASALAAQAIDSNPAHGVKLPPVPDSEARFPDTRRGSVGERRKGHRCALVARACGVGRVHGDATDHVDGERIQVGHRSPKQTDTTPAGVELCRWRVAGQWVEVLWETEAGVAGYE